MRPLIAICLVTLIAANCGDGNSAERPQESARPELTAEDIADELDKLYPEPGQGTVSYRAVIVQQSFNEDGTEEESTREEVVVGNDYYAKFSEGLETLTYEGEDYLRRDSSSKLLTREEAGLGLLDTYFDALAAELEASDQGFFDRSSFDVERLPDELVGEKHALRLRVLGKLDEEELGIFIPDALPTSDANSPTPSLPDRADIRIEFWIEADTLFPLRMTSEYLGYQSGREIQRTLEDWTYFDFNQLEELPVDLPDVAS